MAFPQYNGSRYVRSTYRRKISIDIKSNGDKREHNCFHTLVLIVHGPAAAHTPSKSNSFGMEMPFLFGNAEDIPDIALFRKASKLFEYVHVKRSREQSV